LAGVHLAYLDASGDSGRGGSQTYALGVVLIDADLWPSAFDDLIDYRRFLRRQFKVPVRAEIKAKYLINNKGPFLPLKLSESARFAIYRGLMRLQPKIGAQTFAVVIRKKDGWKRDADMDPFEKAWDWALQRLERFTTKGNTGLLIFNDEGDDQTWIKRRVRMWRRAGHAGSAFGPGVLQRPARLFIDDATPRDSQQSYFIQLADLAAYAAFRKVVPPPPRSVHIAPQSTWDELGNARLTVVSPRGDGLVVWP
jgi:uncharacterized protein DUF3800